MIYKISKGNHRSKIIPSLTFKSKISGLVCFKGDFSYDIGKEQKDTNKILGLSDSWHHHINSIRLGWRWSNEFNCIEIMTIQYKNKVRIIEHLTYAYSDVYYEYSINIHKSFYNIEFNGVSKSLIRDTNYNFIRYKLYPYFGGQETAPNNFKIDII